MLFAIASGFVQEGGMVVSADLGFKPVSEGRRYFVSYKREDVDGVGKIALQLHKIGVPLWYDKGIEGGTEWLKKIGKEISKCDALILFATKDLFLDAKTFVHDEYNTAIQLKKPVYLVWLDRINPQKDVLPAWAVWYEKLGNLQGCSADGRSIEDFVLAIITRFPLIVDIEKLLMYSNVLLERKRYFYAKKYFTYVIEQKPNNAKARAGRLMADMCVTQLQDLIGCNKPIDDNDDYKIAIRYGDNELSSELRKISNVINENKDKELLEKRYRYIKKRMERARKPKDYIEAADLFDKLNGFKDSAELAKKCREYARVAGRAVEGSDNIIIAIGNVITWGRNQISNLLGDENIISKAEDIYIYPTKDQLPNVINIPNQEGRADIKRGEKIQIGRYPQGDKGEVEPLIWKVLEVSDTDGRVLLITDKLIETKAYHEKIEEVSWKECALRRWLNRNFIDIAFTEEELNMIERVQNKSSYITTYGLRDEEVAEDRVFILSSEEVSKYLIYAVDRVAVMSSWANKNSSRRANAENVQDGSRIGWWWIRSSGYFNPFVKYVDAHGNIREWGNIKTSVGFVRPAIWIKLK